MEYSREKLVEIWRRVMPDDPPPAVFDALEFEPRDAPQGEYALFDRAGERSESDALDPYGEADCAGDSGKAEHRRCEAGCGGSERSGDACERDVVDACDALRRAVDRELELTALYHALARWVLAHPAAARCDTRRGSRGVSRELMRLANEQFAAAKAVAGAHLLASGEYHFPAPGRCEVASLRDGLRRAWSLERELVAEYARLEAGERSGSRSVSGGESERSDVCSGRNCGGAGFGSLRRMHSERSLELGGLLSGIFE